MIRQNLGHPKDYDIDMNIEYSKDSNESFTFADFGIFYIFMSKTKQKCLYIIVSELKGYQI